jgi:beta-glucosidase
MYFVKFIKSFAWIVVVLVICNKANSQTIPLFRDEKAPKEARIKDLLQALTLPEKIAMLGNTSPAIDRLKIPAYNWWNESLHGLARAGEATVFPQAIGMAATFNDELLQEEAAAISTEARAKYNLAVKMNRHLWYMGLTFWSPNINIFRDPRWGRGQETYGEDPLLTSKMGTAYVNGLQGNDANYLKVAACAKHLAVHSGPEADRHNFDAVVDEKDLRETYLYSFKKLVDANVEAVMCAYNRVNGEPCCTGKTLITDIVKKEWHFNGHMVTDCGALSDIINIPGVKTTKAELAAAAIKAGINLECGGILQQDVMNAINQGLLTAANVDTALSAILRTQMKLGMFDNDASGNPYARFAEDSVHNDYHVALSRKAAQQSLVLLKNNGVLPLPKDKYESILITGANSASLEAMVGNYHGMSDNIVTVVEGITKAAGPATVVQYDQGSDYTDTTHFGGIWVSQNSDITIAVVGLTPLLEGEEGDAFLSASGGDRASMSLPQAHIAFLKKLRSASKKPIVVVVNAGSAVDMTAITDYADAIILAWYPGEQGGAALADVLFGKVNPSGKLPLTFYQSLSDLPNYKDYAMKGRTYRYYNGPVQYPFGYGLSYTSFDYKWKQEPQAGYKLTDTIRIAVDVANTGNFDGDEVVQVYMQYPNLERMPVKELKAFKRVTVAKGSLSMAHIKIPVTDLQKWDLKEHKWKLNKGTYTICIGKNSSEFILKKSFTVK